MSSGLQLGLVLASVAALLSVMAIVKLLAQHYSWSAELQRKCVHVATGLYALSLPFTFREFWPVAVLTGVAVMVMLVLRLPRFAKTGLSSTLHGVERKSYGELLLTLSVGFLFFFSIDNPVLFVLPIAVLTLSDAAAALVGTRYGQNLFEVEASTKSLEGVAIFFLVTWIVSMVLLLMMTDIGRLNVVLLSLVIAAFGALVEADSWRGFDNLFVPVGIHLFLRSHLETSSLQLLMLTIVFLVLLFAILALAPRLRMSRHAARAYTVLIFLICAVTALHNAILPLTAVVAHIVARWVRPCESPYPDLDLLAVVAGVSLFWLFLGEYAQHNALTVYNLTFAGAALVFLALAGRRRFVVTGAVAAVLFAAVLTITSWNPAAAQWSGTLWPWVTASFALCLGVATLWPSALDRHRAPRTLALALPVPLVLFVTGSLMS